ncbi:MAG: DUF975 family protein [Lachnospiraceae bacterium]|nr:DUF975 family protein [Lachnospiraceae bacterium]
MKRESAELKRIARENLTGRYSVPMGTLVVGTLSCNIPLLLFGWVTDNSAAGMAIYYLASFILSLLSGVLAIGRMWIGMQMARGRQYQFSDMFCAFRDRADRYILAVLLRTLIVLIPQVPIYMLQFMGYRAFSYVQLILMLVYVLVGSIVAIVLNLVFAQVYMLLLDQPDMTTVDAFRKSAELMKGNKGRLFYIDLSFLGWELLAACSFGIGMLWVGPYMVQTQITFYRELTGQLDGQESAGYDYNASVQLFL